MIFLSTPTWAAEFSKTSTTGGPDLIAIVGDFAFGDEKKFIDTALSSQNALVVFQSPGGNLVAGIEIGKAIHLKGFATLVPDDVQCASACALAWLGGRIRFMSDTARVGFHAVYESNDGQTIISSAGNALVGAYLNQLGLPTSAVVYITGAPPEGMQWLNFADAQRFGIDVQRAKIPEGPGVQPAESNAPSRSDEHGPMRSPIPSIKSATYDFITTTNRPNDKVISYLENKYSDQVSYFGKMLTKAAVLADKLAFFRKWPERNYSLRPGSVLVTCENDHLCKAEGIIDWAVSGQAKTSTGSATFSLGWSAESRNWKISAENSRIISRRIAPSARAEALSALPRYQLDDAQSKLVSLSNLSPDSDCFGAQTAGKIVQRKFGEDGLTITGFIVETSDGSREFVNVSIKLDDLDNATRSWVVRGLQTLLAEGRSAEIYVRLCGAAGRVEMLDAVR
jgi:hypothetical protein